MNPDVRAIIRWVPAARGGRREPPRPATRYTAPVRFESDPTEACGTWSLRIQQSVEVHGAEVIEARIAFAVPGAPDQLLREGERFELLEGLKVVAKGVVVPETLQLPQHINEFELALLG